MPDSFADALASQTLVKGPRCTVAMIRDEMDDTDRDQLDAALRDQRALSTHIARALCVLGFEVKGATVQRHRKRECSCPSMTP